jgi:hypothetical protein
VPVKVSEPFPVAVLVVREAVMATSASEKLATSVPVPPSRVSSPAPPKSLSLPASP